MNTSAGTAAPQRATSPTAVEHRLLPIPDDPNLHGRPSVLDLGRRQPRPDQLGTLFEPPGRNGVADVHWPAILAFVSGIVATWAFSYGVPAFLQGPGARALGNVDLSWLAGAVAAGLVCSIAGARTARVPVSEAA